MALPSPVLPSWASTSPDFEDLKVAGLFGPKGSVLDTIGRTPVVRLNNIAPPGVSVFAKLEAFNPLGSVKDRLALGLIEDAERSGALKPGQTVVEATSGNTGIGLAMVCAQKGYPLVIVMAENFSVERRRLMRFLGAQVVLTPAARMGTGMLDTARALADKNGWFLANQFTNPANAHVHARTTAMEILADFEANPLDYWVTGFGTGGTLLGVGDMLRRYSPDTRIVAVEPDNAPMLASGQSHDPAERRSHPRFQPHPMQGWSPDFLSRLVLDAKSRDLIDDFATVSGQEALQTARALASREGILAGISGGATVAAALKVAAQAPPGARVLAMVPDTGERYMSTVLFEGIEAEMSEAEQALANSVKPKRGQRKPVAAPQPRAASAEAVGFVHRHISNPDTPVVMFSTEWCEFCWSVRKLFAAMDVPLHSIDLDAVDFPGGPDFADAVRLALRDQFRANTVPQVFVGGQHLGGAFETMTAHDTGALQRRLSEAGVAASASNLGSAEQLLPRWAQRPATAKP